MRSGSQKVVDFLSFPVRALILINDDRWGCSSLATERFDYVAREVRGCCLDVGCGRHNRLITRFLNGNGKGIDIFPYDGLTPDQVFENLLVFPFGNEAFESVTFVANINHVPKSHRDTELAEAFRCLKPGGNIVITMGNPVAEILVHQLVKVYDRCFGTFFDEDCERELGDQEETYLTDGEIVGRMKRAGFVNVRKKYFVTQWGLNHLFTGIKPAG